MEGKPLAAGDVYEADAVGVRRHRLQELVRRGGVCRFQGVVVGVPANDTAVVDDCVHVFVG